MITVGTLLAIFLSTSDEMLPIMISEAVAPVSYTHLDVYKRQMYPLSYYRKLLYGFLIGGSTYWSELGYTGIVLLAVLLLLFGGKKTGGCVPDLYL